ncbi:MAG TPA: hypothetical protein VGP61_05220, partial [Gemmatimonadales bacterium]|nr:hypothetical protein [Gemmatimonadales bacterium]
MTTSSEAPGGDPTGRLMRRYAGVLAAAGPLLLLAAALADPRWRQHPVAILLVLGGTTLLRASPVRLSKYAYLNQTGIVAWSAALAAPGPVGVIGLIGGVLLADLSFLRKSFPAALVNAGREGISFAVAFGFYALALRLSGVSSLGLD